jgi:predicted RNA-binding Zn-ribbon protein involved in translation (DUF1610 family)
MFDSSENLQHGKANRCAVCERQFGLIRYYSWRTPLCSKKCVGRLEARRETDRKWLCQAA